MAYIDFEEITHNSASIIVTDLQAVNYVRIFYFYLNDEYKGSRRLSASAEDATDISVSYTYRNLKSDTDYDIKVSVCRAENGDWLANIEDSFHTEKPPVYPWTWEDCQTINDEIGEASDAETMGAYQALINKKGVNQFSYKIWNDLCLKTQEVRLAYGASDGWKTSQDGFEGLTFYNTLMSEDDKILTAVRFNSLRINIGSMIKLSGIPFPVQKDDTVYASYFLTLANALNDIIAEL